MRQWIDLFEASAVLEDPEFRKWFGTSKVTDTNGNPMLLYHGSRRKFVGGPKAHNARHHLGHKLFFASESPEAASGFAGADPKDPGEEHEWLGGHVTPLYMRVENPFHVHELTDLEGHNSLPDSAPTLHRELLDLIGPHAYHAAAEYGEWAGIENDKVLALLKQHGHDGFTTWEAGGVSWACFSDDQIRPLYAPKEELAEGMKLVAPLYHGTTISRALYIFHDGVLNEGSLTRDYEIALDFCEHAYERVTQYEDDPLTKLQFDFDQGWDFGKAVFAFDQTRLRQKLKTKPFVYNADEEYASAHHRRSEAEERAPDIRDIERYLLGVEVNREGFEQFAKLVAEHHPEYLGAVERMRKFVCDDVRPRAFRALTEWDDYEDEEDLELETHILDVGTKVYHGTGAPDFDGHPWPPYWVTDSKIVAEYFAKGHAYEDAKPTVYELKVTRSLNLAVLDRNAFDDIEDRYGVTFDGPEDGDDFIRVLRQLGFDGWYIGDNYPEGSDIMIAVPDAVTMVNRERLAESEGEIEISYDGSWIESDGTVHWCDHIGDYHHDQIVRAHFLDDEELHELEQEYLDTDMLDGFDDYISDAIADRAFDDGWVRVSQPGGQAIAVQAAKKMTRAQRNAVMLQINPNAESFSVEGHNGVYLHTRDKEEFLRALKRC
jgi:hypothetical protein